MHIHYSYALAMAIIKFIMWEIERGGDVPTTNPHYLLLEEEGIQWAIPFTYETSTSISLFGQRKHPFLLFGQLATLLLFISFIVASSLGT